MIQTYYSAYDIFNQIINNDYESMFNSQIKEREKFKYPPFYKLIKILKSDDLIGNIFYFFCFKIKKHR